MTPQTNETPRRPYHYAPPTSREPVLASPAMFANTQALTHAERRRLRDLNLSRREHRLTAAETLERAALRFRMIGMEVD